MNGERKHRTVLVALLRFLVVLVVILGGVSPVPTATGAQVPPPTETTDIGVPGGLSGNEWATIQDQIHQAEYYLTWQAPNGAAPAYRAPNRAQGFAVAFTPQGFTATGDAPGAVAWHFGLTLTAYGDTSLPAAVAREDLRADDATVTYHWNDRVSEWYINQPAGVKHGLTLYAPPASIAARTPEVEGPTSSLQLTFVLDTDLVPTLSADGQVLTLRAPASGDWQAGPAVLRYAGLHVTDAIGRAIPAYIKLSPFTLRIIVDATSAIYPLTVDPLLTSQTAKLSAADGMAGDTFGYAVAVSGDTAVVGALEDDDLGINSGSAYVFTRNQSGADGWGQVIKLTADDGAAGDGFGNSVAVSGDTVAVGADGDDDHGSLSGSAYVFTRNQGGADAWGQVIKLTAADGAANDWFGSSVALSGDTLIIGVHGDDDLGSDSGSAYVFARNQGGADAWGQVAKLTASDGAIGDMFGSDVTVSGDTVAVGADGDDDLGSNSGSAYVFTRNQGGADAWGQVAKLTASDGAADDYFGGAVAVSGDTLVVGADRDDDLGSDSGSAYVFARNQGGADAWGQVAKLTASDGAAGDRFGVSVAVSDDTIIVGARYDDDLGNGSGSAYVFARNQGGADAWGQVIKLTASDGAADDAFGLSTAVSGDTLVIGAHGNESTGSAYVFTRSGNTWVQISKPTAADGAADDYFGRSVAVSGDTLVVGAVCEDGMGTNSGSAYVFTRNQGGADAWSQVIKLTAADGTGYKYFGSAVAVSGNTIVVGTPYDNVHGSRSGSAYVFTRNQGGADAWGQVAKLTASDGAADDEFGHTVAVSGDTLIIGANHDNSRTGSAYVFTRNQGGADAWGQVAKLTATDGAADDLFGESVAVSGDTVVIGAPQDEDNGDASGSAYVFTRNQGGADAWDQVAKLTAADGTFVDLFGESVAVSGDTIIVGAHGDDDHGSYTGAAYVFTRNQGGADTWGQVAKLTATDGAAGDEFGWSVAVSGDTVAVGAYGDDDHGSRSGSAYVFTRNQGGADAWGQVAKLTTDDGAADDYFGYAVSVSGDTVVVGAYRDDDHGSDSGSAYVYQLEYVPPLSNLVIVKSVDPLSVAPGEAITYTLVFSNTGSITATGVTITDTIPVSVTNTSVISSGIVITQHVGTRYVWDVADLAPGAGGTITITGVLTTPLAAGVLTNTATITATTDSNPANNTSSTALTVLNVAPVADDDAFTVLENSSANVLDVLGGDTDANGDTISVDAVGEPPNGAAVDNDTNVLYTPDPDFFGTDIFTYTVSDGNGGFGSATITVTVTNLNDPPVADAGMDQAVDTAVAVTLNGSGSSDPDGDLPLTYYWTQTGGPAVTLSDPAVVSPTFTSPSDPAVLTFTLSVTDSLGLADPTPDVVVITVNNQAPTAAAGSDQSVDTGATVTLDGSGSSDPDGDLPLSYHWSQTGGPVVTLSNPAVVSPTFTAPSDPTVLTFTLTVTDSLGLPDPTPDVAVVTVNNQAPTADAGSDQSVNTGVTVTLDGSSSSDPDDDLPLSYHWSQTGGPAVALSDPAVVSPTFTAPSDPTVLTFTLTVTDSLGLADPTPDVVVVTVNNQAPTADAGSDQSVNTGVTATLDGSSSSDPDDDLPLSYHWSQTGGPAVTLSDPAVVSPTFTAPSDPAVLTFTLSVTDSLGLADPTPDVVVVTVNNQAPTATAGSDQSVNTGATVTLDGSGSSDPDGDLPLSYHWSQTGGPAVALSDPTVVAPTFTAPGIPAVLTFTLAVTDSLGLADPTLDEVVITVEEYHIYLPLVVQQDESSAAQAEHTQQQTPATQVGFVSESGQPWLIPSVGSPLLLGLALWRKRQSKEFA